MKSIISADQVNDFFEIHSQNIELVDLQNQSSEIEVLSKEIINSTKELELRWTPST